MSHGRGLVNVDCQETRRFGNQSGYLLGESLVDWEEAASAFIDFKTE